MHSWQAVNVIRISEVQRHSQKQEIFFFLTVITPKDAQWGLVQSSLTRFGPYESVGSSIDFNIHQRSFSSQPVATR